jgi:manganese transport protein
MLLLAAGSLQGVAQTDSIEGAHAAITAALGPAVGVLFGIGLLASGLASTSVGSYAGAAITTGLLRVRVSMPVLRLLTLIPALGVLAIGVSPTWALVLSQVLLSFGLPFALVPLVWLTSHRDVMGPLANRPLLSVLAWVVVALIVALNLALIFLTLSGAG